ncbi:uncharacterized protein METZ01_LOCUS335403, partial [marine metagenome]
PTFFRSLTKLRAKTEKLSSSLH